MDEQPTATPEEVAAPPEEIARGKPFDAALVEQFTDAIHAALTAHPELRSVAVAFDYVGDLNRSNVSKGVWMGAQGPVTQMDAVFGSSESSLCMLHTQMLRATQIHDNMRDEARALGTELLRRRQEREQTEDRRGGGADEGQPDVVGDAGAAAGPAGD
jgi:hypothetical protein